MKTINSTVPMKFSQVHSRAGKEGSSKKERLTAEEENYLVRLARGGDRKSMSALCVAFRDRIFAIAHKVGKGGAKNPAVNKDLVQDGYLGLLDAVRLYNKKKGASFGTYALFRIKGSMRDGLRKGSPLSRGEMKAVRTAVKIFAILTGELLRQPTHTEWKDALPQNLQDVFEKIRVDAGFVFLSSSHVYSAGDEDQELSVENLASSDGGMTDWERREDSGRFLPVLLGTLNLFTERERAVLLRHVQPEGLVTLRKLGKLLGLTESRLSQIQTKVFWEFRNYLTNNYPVLTREARERALEH